MDSSVGAVTVALSCNACNLQLACARASAECGSLHAQAESACHTNNCKKKCFVETGVLVGVPRFSWMSVATESWLMPNRMMDMGEARVSVQQAQGQQPDLSLSQQDCR